MSDYSPAASRLAESSYPSLSTASQPRLHTTNTCRTVRFIFTQLDCIECHLYKADNIFTFLEISKKGERELYFVGRKLAPVGSVYVFCMSPVYPHIHENSPDQPMCSSVSEKRSKGILLRSSHPYFTGDASAF